MYQNPSHAIKEYLDKSVEKHARICVLIAQLRPREREARRFLNKVKRIQSFGELANGRVCS
jgi:hypothetical protein